MKKKQENDLKIVYFILNDSNPRYRTKKTLKVDKHLNLVEEEPEKEELNPNHEDYKELLQEKAKNETKANNTPTSTTSQPQISDYQKKITEFFVDTFPCWFEGCEELRKQYKKEIETEEEKGTCTNCKKGAIMRKYRDLITSKYTKDDFEKDKNKR